MCFNTKFNYCYYYLKCFKIRVLTGEKKKPRRHTVNLTGDLVRKRGLAVPGPGRLRAGRAVRTEFDRTFFDVRRAFRPTNRERRRTNVSFPKFTIRRFFFFEYSKSFGDKTKRDCSRYKQYKYVTDSINITFFFFFFAAPPKFYLRPPRLISCLKNGFYLLSVVTNGIIIIIIFL